MMIDDGNYGLSQHTLTAIVVSVAYNVFESAGKVEKKQKIEKKNNKKNVRPASSSRHVQELSS